MKIQKLIRITFHEEDLEKLVLEQVRSVGYTALGEITADENGNWIVYAEPLPDTQPTEPVVANEKPFHRVVKTTTPAAIVPVAHKPNANIGTCPSCGEVKRLYGEKGECRSCSAKASWDKRKPDPTAEKETSVRQNIQEGYYENLGVTISESMGVVAPSPVPLNGNHRSH